MHRKIINYLEQEHGIFIERNSECYYDQPMISFNVDAETFDQIVAIGEFTIDNIKYSKTSPPHDSCKETYKDGSKCIYLKTDYLDTDTYHTDITEGGRTKYGAIAPNGRFYECWYEGHRDMEDDLVARGLMTKTSGWRNTGYESNGWVKLTGAYSVVCELEFQFQETDYDYNTKETTVIRESKITKEQVETIKAYIESLGRDKFILNHHWFWLSKIECFIGISEKEMYDKFDDVEVKPRLSEDEGKAELLKNKAHE